VNDLNYASRYFGNPAWFKLNGKPVVMFYGNLKYDVGTWGSIRSQADGGRAATWIGEGDIFSYLSVFDGIHPYSITWSPDPAKQLASYAAKTRAVGADKLWVATVMPGYDDTRLGRGSAGYARGREGVPGHAPFDPVRRLREEAPVGPVRQHQGQGDQRDLVGDDLELLGRDHGDRGRGRHGGGHPVPEPWHPALPLPGHAPSVLRLPSTRYSSVSTRALRSVISTCRPVSDFTS
jgi:hypothetical protein